jgi:integrase
MNNHSLTTTNRPTNGMVNAVPHGTLTAGNHLEAQTVAEVLDWFATAEPYVAQSEVAAIERDRARAMFRAAYGHRRIEDCRPYMLLDYINSLRGCKAANTKRRLKTIILRPFNYALQLGVILRNPFLGLRLPMGKEGRDWTEAEFQAVLRNSQPNFRRLIVFLRYSGARPGEARALRWADIRTDLKMAILKHHKMSHKTDAARRIVFNHVTLKLLAWMARRKENPEYVVVTRYGTPWRHHSATHRLRDVRQRAGLGEDVKLHGCRHLWATSAIVNGVDLKTVSQLLGHKTLQVTQRYLHLANKLDHLDAAAEKAIGGTLSAPTEKPDTRRVKGLHHQPQQPKVAPASPQPTATGLTNSQRQAYCALDWAIRDEPRLASASEVDVFKFLWSNRDRCPFKVPNNLLTFRRYLGDARKLHGDGKRLAPGTVATPPEIESA